MSLNAELQLDIRSYWHTGSGQGNGYHLDALCEKDQNGLPVVPGRQLKGLLRHAVHRAEQWGWLDDIQLPAGPAKNCEELLFGSVSQQESRSKTQPGMLMVDTAQLPESERAWLGLNTEEATSLRRQLFAELYSTAIDHQTGTAKQYSLRGKEACIPLALLASLELQVTANSTALAEQQQQAIENGLGWKVIQQVLPLFDAVGANRSRGFGEVIVTLNVPAKGA